MSCLAPAFWCWPSTIFLHEAQREKKIRVTEEGPGFVLLLLLLRPWWTSISLAAAVVQIEAAGYEVPLGCGLDYCTY